MLIPNIVINRINIYCSSFIIILSKNKNIIPEKPIIIPKTFKKLIFHLLKK